MAASSDVEIDDDLQLALFALYASAYGSVAAFDPDLDPMELRLIQFDYIRLGDFADGGLDNLGVPGGTLTNRIGGCQHFRPSTYPQASNSPAPPSSAISGAR